MHRRNLRIWLIGFGLAVSFLVLPRGVARAQIQEARAYGSTTLADSTPSGNESEQTDVPFFMGSSANFRFNYYDDTTGDHAVFIRQKFSETKSIYAGMATDMSPGGKRHLSKDLQDTQNSPYPNYHQTPMRDFVFFDGWESMNPKIKFYIPSHDIDDQTRATNVSVTLRWKYRSACSLQKGCLSGNLDTIKLEVITGLRGDAWATMGGLWVWRYEWGDGFPVELQAGFSSQHPQPFNLADITVHKNKKYIYNPMINLPCSGANACYSDDTWNNAPAGLISDWNNSGTWEDRPLKIYALFWAGPLRLPFEDFGSWNVCMGNVSGTPCHMTPPEETCNSGNRGQKIPGGEGNGQWWCMEVMVACFPLPQYQATPPPNVGLYPDSLIDYDPSDCGSCDSVRIVHGTMRELDTAASISQSELDCPTSGEVVVYVPAGNWWQDQWRIKTDNSYPDEPGVLEIYVPWDYDENQEVQCWGNYAPLYEWVYVLADPSIPDYCP